MNNPNLITLKGKIKRGLEQKLNSRGEPYYFTFLAVEEHEKDVPVFLWNPDYGLMLRAEGELTIDTEATLIGKWNKDQTIFHFTEWKLEGLEIF